MSGARLKEIAYSRVLTFMIFYLVIVIYQTLLSELLRLGPARLDLGLLLLIYVTLNLGSRPGIVFGFGLGLLLDVADPIWLGLGSLIMGTLGYGVGYFKESLFVESIYSKMLLVFLTVISHDILRYLFMHKFELSAIGSVLLGTTIFSALYTTAVAAIVMLMTKPKQYQPQPV